MMIMKILDSNLAVRKIRVTEKGKTNWKMKLGKIKLRTKAIFYIIRYNRASNLWRVFPKSYEKNQNQNILSNVMNSDRGYRTREPKNTPCLGTYFCHIYHITLQLEEVFSSLK